MEEYQEALAGPTPPNEQALKDSIAASITKAIKEREKEEVEQELILSTQAGLVISKSKDVKRGKRVLSAQLQQEQERAHKKQKAWNGMVVVANFMDCKRNAWETEYGEIEAPEEIVEDKTLPSV